MRLEKLARALILFGLNADFLVRQGVPFQEALKVAEEKDSGLIVLGSHGRSTLREAFTGSTFENVARLSRRPVLVVRGKADGAAASARKARRGISIDRIVSEQTRQVQPFGVYCAARRSNSAFLTVAPRGKPHCKTCAMPVRWKA